MQAGPDSMHPARSFAVTSFFFLSRSVFVSPAFSESKIPYSVNCVLVHREPGNHRSVLINSMCYVPTQDHQIYQFQSSNVSINSYYTEEHVQFVKFKSFKQCYWSGTSDVLLYLVRVVRMSRQTGNVCQEDGGICGYGSQTASLDALIIYSSLQYKPCNSNYIVLLTLRKIKNMWTKQERVQLSHGWLSKSAVTCVENQ